MLLISSFFVPAILEHFSSLILKLRVLSSPKTLFYMWNWLCFGFLKLFSRIVSIRSWGNCPVCPVGFLKSSVTACFLSFTLSRYNWSWIEKIKMILLSKYSILKILTDVATFNKWQSPNVRYYSRHLGYISEQNREKSLASWRHSSVSLCICWGRKLL